MGAVDSDFTGWIMVPKSQALELILKESKDGKDAKDIPDRWGTIPTVPPVTPVPDPVHLAALRARIERIERHIGVNEAMTARGVRPSVGAAAAEDQDE